MEKLHKNCYLERVGDKKKSEAFMHLMNIEGKIALVTGSSKGIGKAIAIMLSKVGAIPIITGRNLETVENTVNEINSCGKESYGISVDLTDKFQRLEMIEKINDRYGTIDILVNNVGGSLPPVPFDELDENLWESQIDNNLNTTFNCTKLVVKSMKEKKNGRIVNIASVAGRSYSHLGGVPYAAAKHAVIGLTRQLSRELAIYGITVNCVAPGLIETERILKKIEKKKYSKIKDIIKMIPIRRMGKPEEVAGAVVFLVSNLSSYITGAVIDVNGGMLMI